MSNLSKSVQKCPMSIGDILAEEPRLLNIINDGLPIMERLKDYEKDRIWYKDLKKRMTELVGFDSKNPRLQSCEVYDTVYFFFIDLFKI